MANTMYPAMANSPKTELSAAITATDTTIKVVDATKLPKAPNILTILSGDTSETISYATVSGNDLTGCVRGLNGTAKAWSPGMKVSRTYTAYDHDTFIEQIKDIFDKLATASTTKLGLTQLSDATTSTATDRAATSNAVKKVAEAASQSLTDAKKYVDDRTWQKHKMTEDNGTAISKTNVSMNTLTMPGMYSGTNFTDSPDSTTGFFNVLVIPSALQDYLIQIAFKFGSDNGFGMFIRSRRDGVWYAWSRDVTMPTTNIIYGKGTPEGAVNASLGTMFINLNAGAGTTFYVKEGGAGNMGWKSK